jgi:hypothetical protein
MHYIGIEAMRASRDVQVFLWLSNIFRCPRDRHFLYHAMADI